MLRICVLAMAGLVSVFASGQVRLRKLTIGPKEVYELKGSDIIVVDTLVMMDSSRLILNPLKTDNFIHAKSAIFHRGCLIDGKGVRGIEGNTGRNGSTTPMPCTDGERGRHGSDGTNGGRGKNLSFYYSEFYVRGSLTIDVSGGDAGDGGTGGSGGGGGPGTRICPGGNGGLGGGGSDGGNGGDGGSVTFHSPRAAEIRLMIGSNVVVRNYGGNHGIGGEGGPGGYAGLSPNGANAMDGKPGKKGRKGTDGVAGKPGPINFIIK